MIDNGRKVLDGTLAEVKAQYGQKFIHVRIRRRRPLRVRPALTSSRCKDSGREMEIELDDLADANRCCKDLSGRCLVNGFQLSEPSLQNIFIRKVKEGAGA